MMGIFSFLRKFRPARSRSKRSAFFRPTFEVLERRDLLSTLLASPLPALPLSLSSPLIGLEVPQPVLQQPDLGQTSLMSNASDTFAVSGSGMPPPIHPLVHPPGLNITSTTLTSSVNPSVYNQSVTFTATVTSHGNPVSGTVTFKDGSTTLATETLVDGTTTYATSSLAVGSHDMVADYNGGGEYYSSSASLTQVVDQDDTTSTVTSSDNPSDYGASVTFTASVAVNSPGAGTPTGTVTFLDGTTTLGTATLSSGSATYATTGLALGSHTITVSYGGDTDDATSTSADLSQIVKNVTTTSLSSSTNPSVYGQSVTLTATVTISSPGSGTATGTVTFYNGGVSLGTATLSSGTATFGTTSLPTGTDSITATYSGDSTDFGSSSSALSQTVDKDDTTTTVTSSANPSAYETSVTFTATVAADSPGSGTPTGTVTFKDGGSTLGTATLSAGSATYSTSSLSMGSHSITVSYGGNTNFNTSTSGTLTQSVEYGTTTDVTSSINPSTYGESVTFTAVVTEDSPGTGTPTGTVTFYDDSVYLGTATLSSGTATCTTSSLTLGSNSITAVYGGDSDNVTSTSAVLDQTVDKATPTVTVSDSGGVYDDAAYSASGTVAGGSSLEGVWPTFAYYVGTSDIGSSTSTAPANVGTYTVVASFAGSTDYNSASSSPVTFTITAAALTITANNVSMTYADGTTLSGSTGFTSSGLQGSDIIGSVTLSTDATLSSSGNWNVGVWSITPSAADFASGSAGNYTIAYDNASTGLTVTAKALTVTGMTADNKVYDATTTATLNNSADALSGVISSDIVTLVTSSTGTFATANVGTDITVTAGGFGLSGADSGDYTLTQPTATASITPKALTVSGMTASNKVYDGTTAATINNSGDALVGVISGDSVTLSTTTTANFATPNVGTGITVTASGFTISGSSSGNYTLTQPTTTANITAQGLTITADNVEMTYADGTTLNDSSGFNVSGLQGADSISSVTLTTDAPLSSSGNWNAGSWTITPSAAIFSSGSAGNYSISYDDASLTVDTRALTVTGLTADDKVYDGTTTATVNNGADVLSGVIGGDDVTLDPTTTGNFASSAVGTWTVTASGFSLSGTDSANYTVTQPTTTASILTAAPDMSAVQLSNDGQQGFLLPIGEAQVDLNDGAVQVSQALDLDDSDAARNDLSSLPTVGGEGAALSPLPSGGEGLGGEGAALSPLPSGGEGQGGEGFSLTYNSATAGGPVMLQVILATDSSLGVPSSIKATLTLDGTAQSPVSFSTSGHSSGDTYLLSVPGAIGSLTTGVYAYQVDVQVNYSGSELDESGTGDVVIVNRTASALGAGWGLAGLPQLVAVAAATDVPAGVLWVDGSGSYRFFSGSGSFASPANDFGTLVQNGDDSYTYTSLNNAVYQFNPAGLCTSMTNPGTPGWSFTYDDDGNLTLVTAVDGSTSSFSYSGGLLAGITEPGSRSLAFTEDGSGNITKITDVDGTNRTFGYSSGTNLLVTDQWTPWNTSFTYDSDALLTGVALGSVQTYTITPAAAQGLASPAPLASLLGVASVEDGDSHTTVYTFDTLGRITSETQPAGLTQTWALNSSGQATQYVDQDGFTTGYSYSGGDLMVVDYPDGSTQSNTYDSTFNQLLSSTDGDGNITKFTLNDYGEVTSTTTAYGTSVAVTTHQTWSGGLLQTSTDGDLNVTSLTYNDTDQLTAQITTDSSSNVVDDESFTYDDNGYQASQIVGVGGGSPQTSYTGYSPRDLLLTQTDADGNVTSNAYNRAGNQVSTIDPRGIETTYNYNAADQVTDQIDDSDTGSPETNPDGYDGAGNDTTSTDADGNITSNTYNSDNRLISTVTHDIDGNLVSSWSGTYDGDGNVATQTDGDGNITSAAYNYQGLLLTQTIYDSSANLLSAVTNTYDHDSNLKTSTDGDNNVTSNTYDAQDRLTGETVKDSSGTVVNSYSETFDKDGNVVTYTDGDNNVTSDTYNGEGNVLVETVKDSSGVLISAVTNTYNRDGEQPTDSDGDGNITSSTFDTDGNVLTQVVTNSTGTTLSMVTNTYDADDNLLTSTDGDGNVTSNTYSDDDLPLTQVIKNSSGATVSSFSQTYDDDDNVLTYTDGDNNITSNTYLDNQLVAQLVTSSSTTISSFSETFDKDGNLVTYTDADNNITSNIYDGNQQVGQLITNGSTTISSYSETIDKDGNVLTYTDGDNNITSNTYDDNQLTAQLVTKSGATVSYLNETFDKDGNVVTYTDGDNNITSNTYDGNQLTGQLVTKSGTTISYFNETFDDAGNVSTYTDGDNNITSNTYTDDQLTGQLVTNGSTTVSYYSETLDDDGNVKTYTDGDGNITSNTYTGNQLTGQLVTRSGTTVSYFNETFDDAGNVSTYTDGDNNITSNSYVGSQLTGQVVTNGSTTLSYFNETFDDAGNVSTYTDGDSNITSNTYTGNQLTAQLVTNGSTTISYFSETFDKDANVVTYTDGDGNITSNTYFGNQLTGQLVTKSGTTISYFNETFDDAGNVSTYTDADGNITSNSYVGNQLTGQVVTKSGTTISYFNETFDDAGNVSTYTDGDGNITSNTYVGSQLTGQLVTKSGTTVSYFNETFDDAGNVSTYTDGDGNITSNTYLGNQLTGQLVTKSGTTVSYFNETFDDAGNVSTYTDGDGNITSNSYTGNQLTGQLVTRSGTTVSYFSETLDDAGNVSTCTDGDGNITSNSYAGNQLTAQLVTNGSTTVSYYSETFDDAGNVSSYTDGDGNITSNTYTGNQLTSQLVTKSGATVSYFSETYDDAGNVVTCTDGDGNITSNTYTGNQLTGQLVTKSGTTISYFSETYDDAGNVNTYTDADLNVTSNTYVGNELTSQVVSNTTGTTFSQISETYDDAGNVLTYSDGDGNITSNTYLGNQLTGQVVTNGGTTLSYFSESLDDAGNVSTYTDGDGNITSNTYTGNELTAQVVTKSGTTISSFGESFDKDGNVTAYTDGDANVTSSTYAGNELTSQVVKSSGGTVVTSVGYGYDDNGNQLTVTDGDGNVTANTYSGNRVVETTVTDSSDIVVSTQTYAYDDDGNQISETDPDARTISSTYVGNEMVSQTWYNASSSVVNTLSWSYDDDGNMLTASSYAGAYTMTYQDNRMISQVGPTGITLLYGYDENSNVSTITDSLGATTGMSYNENGQLLGVSYQDSEGQLREDFTYDEAGNLLTSTQYSNLAGTTVAGSSTYTYQGDQVTSIVHKDGSGTVLASYSYSYDSAGRLGSEVDNGTTTSYGYDAAGQLISAGSQSYSYDLAGNPDDSGYTIGPDNEVLNDGTWSYTYDSAGNVTQKIDSSTGMTWTYGHDDQNHQTSAVEKDSSGTTYVSLTYTFDVFGQRIESSIDNYHPVPGTSFTKYLYSDGALYATVNDLSETTHYLSGSQPNQWLASVDYSGTVSWLETDHLNSIVLIATNSGTVLNQISYDAFGNIISQTSGAPALVLAYAGYQYDVITGYYCAGDGTREYNPGAGVWTSNDPIGIDGGQPNFHEYVANNPTNATDPTGKLLLAHGEGAKWLSDNLKKQDVSFATLKLPSGTVYFDLMDPKTESKMAPFYGPDWAKQLVQAGRYDNSNLVVRPDAKTPVFVKADGLSEKDWVTIIRYKYITALAVLASDPKVAENYKKLEDTFYSKQRGKKLEPSNELRVIMTIFAANSSANYATLLPFFDRFKPPEAEPLPTIGGTPPGTYERVVARSNQAREDEEARRRFAYNMSLVGGGTEFGYYFKPSSNPAHAAGYIQSLCASVQAIEGVALLVTPCWPLGLIMLGLGVDNFVAGAQTMASGEHQSTVLNKGMQALLKQCGASDSDAKAMAAGLEVTINLSADVAAGVKLAAAKANAPLTKAEILAINKVNGKAAEGVVALQLEAEGNTILGSNVTIRSSLGDRRVDHLIRTPEGQLVAVEVKSGGGVRDASQLAKDELIATEGGIVVGNNAPAVLRGKRLIIPTIVRRVP